MKTALLAVLFSAGGYALGVAAGIALIHLISTKQDKSVEAVMTGFFFTGPLMAVVVFLGSLIYFWTAKSGQ